MLKSKSEGKLEYLSFMRSLGEHTRILDFSFHSSCRRTLWERVLKVSSGWMNF